MQPSIEALEKTINSVTAQERLNFSINYFFGPDNETQKFIDGNAVQDRIYNPYRLSDRLLILFRALEKTEEKDAFFCAFLEF